ncbi:hypothetical protein [Arthrobacter caoxuetaonis]|uniref:Uncharacterized protein n=1 Tax=Arthrobacter caoxuetaonis TaxID=2886935 RepID=A0A9X1SGK9_9MICC|nr:hypothetical protein [Arthrobacter caoxuetaonis]MCC3299474.1 hypothetical protein [Arthrobacter caoxuetaonis]USQ59034.1 hypothetical protein NF551_18180 [Arthrobacter caoxuetaonis]
MSAINSLYSLTPMTGRTSGADRTTVIGTVEMKWRTFWIAVFAMVPGGILTAVFYPMLDAWSFLWIAVTEALAFYLIERRSKEGLRLRTYQTFFDKKKSNINEFYLCGQRIDVGGEEFGTIRQITAPVGPDDRPRKTDFTTFEDFEESLR